MLYGWQGLAGTLAQDRNLKPTTETATTVPRDCGASGDDDDGSSTPNQKMILEGTGNIVKKKETTMKKAGMPMNNRLHLFFKRHNQLQQIDAPAEPAMMVMTDLP